ncbi:hypothetical protein D3C85_1316270 [compost metagenome]
MQRQVGLEAQEAGFQFAQGVGVAVLAIQDSANGFGLDVEALRQTLLELPEQQLDQGGQEAQEDAGEAEQLA